MPRRQSPLHAALRHLVNKSFEPHDARLRAMAAGGGGHSIPEQDDESELHKAIADELGVDGRPRSMETVAAMEGEKPKVEHNPAAKPTEPPPHPPTDVNETGTHEAPTPEEEAPEETDGKKRRRGVRF